MTIIIVILKIYLYIYFLPDNFLEPWMSTFKWQLSVFLMTSQWIYLFIFGLHSLEVWRRSDADFKWLPAIQKAHITN